MTIAEWRERALVAEAALGTAREALEYVLDHHADGNECLCGAARSVAKAGVRLTDAEYDGSDGHA